MSKDVDKSVALGGYFRDWTRKCREKLAGAADEKEVFLGVMLFGNAMWMDHQPPSEAAMQETLRKLRDGERLEVEDASIAQYLTALGLMAALRTGQMGNDPSLVDAASFLINTGVSYLYEKQLDHLDDLEARGRFIPGGPSVN